MPTVRYNDRIRTALRQATRTDPELLVPDTQTIGVEFYGKAAKLIGAHDVRLEPAAGVGQLQLSDEEAAAVLERWESVGVTDLTEAVTRSIEAAASAVVAGEPGARVKIHRAATTIHEGTHRVVYNGRRTQ